MHCSQIINLRYGKLFMSINHQIKCWVKFKINLTLEFPFDMLATDEELKHT